MANKFTNHIAVVLDRSGSMQAVRDATIEGFNGWLADIQGSAPESITSVILFSTESLRFYDRVMAKAIRPLTREDYRPDGFTALYDAVGEAVDALAATMTKPKKDRALVVIITDGQENSSRQMNRETLRAKIAELEATGKWTFTYLSAHADAWNDAMNLGIRAGNTAQYDVADTLGVFSRKVSVGTQNWVASPSAATASFYGDDPDKEETWPRPPRA